MSKLVGIDIRPNVIRVAVIRTSYRRLHLESIREVSTSGFDEPEHVLRHAAGEFTRHGEQVAVTIGGQSAYIHRLALPPAALKQVDDVVPFELEGAYPWTSRTWYSTRGYYRVREMTRPSRCWQLQHLQS